MLFSAAIGDKDVLGFDLVLPKYKSGSSNCCASGIFPPLLNKVAASSACEVCCFDDVAQSACALPWQQRDRKMAGFWSPIALGWLHGQPCLRSTKK